MTRRHLCAATRESLMTSILHHTLNAVMRTMAPVASRHALNRHDLPSVPVGGARLRAQHWKQRSMAAVLGFVGCASASATDWAGDFDLMLQQLPRHYANFEYTLTERRLDLPALAQRERQALAAATDDAQRRAAFDRMIRAFADPHLRIDWAPGAAGPGPACGQHRLPPGVAFHRLPGFVPLQGPGARQFSAGVLRGEPVLGILRIGLFVERAFGSACAEAAQQVGIDASAPCDTACGDALDRATVGVLNRALAATVRELEAAGAQRLVIDVTDNAGGSDWSETVARLLAGPLRSAPVAMLRHPAWTAHLNGLRKEIDALRHGASGPEVERLQQATLQLDAALPQLQQTCDLRAAWTDAALATGQVPLPCSNLVTGRLFASGFEPDGPLGRTSAVDALLFRPAWYGSFPVGVASRPLAVLVNHETHSSAEQFAALLRDNGRALVVGIPTSGAGCGTFTDLGTTFTLPGTGAQVHAPDCVRLRRDGTNERDGIVPDRLVSWRRSDSAWQLARKAAQALRALSMTGIGTMEQPGL